MFQQLWSKMDLFCERSRPLNLYCWKERRWGAPHACSTMLESQSSTRFQRKNTIGFSYTPELKLLFDILSLLITHKQALHVFNNYHYTFCPAHRLSGCPCPVWSCDSVWAELLSGTGRPGPWWVGVPSSGLSDRCFWSLYSLHREESSAPTYYWLLTQTQKLMHRDAMRGLNLLTALNRR